MNADAVNWEPAWRIPRGLAVDPIFEGELALALGKTIGEIRRDMSLWELTVFWPAHFSSKHRRDARAAVEAQQRQERERRRI